MEYSRRTQDGDGRRGSKGPNRIVGRTWLRYSCLAAQLLRLPGVCFVLRYCLLLSSFLRIALFIGSDVVSSARYSKCLPRLPRPVGGGAIGFPFCFFFFCFFFSRVFSVSFFCYLSFIECVCRACRIHYHEIDVITVSTRLTAGLHTGQCWCIFVGVVL